jgi:gliding motility-associated-like protein
MKQIILFGALILCLLTCTQISYSQTFFNITGSPIDTISCMDTCISLYAEHLPIKKTNVYSSSSIPYSPYNITNGTSLNLTDDQFSDSISIGFNFCFYENSYTHCYVSSNGHLTFNSAYKLGSASFDTQNPLPYYNATTFPDNAIFLPFTDFNIEYGGSISYSTVGVAPFRKFIVKYQNIPFFDTINCGMVNSSFQCELNETYNTIDIFILNKPTCNASSSNWLNYSTLGVQSLGAANFYTVPNKNASIWTSTNEAWEIFPNGPKATHVNWYSINNTLLASNVDTFQFCNQIYPQTCYATITYECPYAQYSDIITIQQFKPQITNIAVTPIFCVGDSNGTCTISATSIYNPILYSVGNSGFGTSNTFSNLTDGWFYASIMDSLGCTQSQLIYIDITSTLNFSQNLIFANCTQSNGSACITPFGGVPPFSILWSNGDTTNCVSNLSSNLYSVTVTDATGCSITKPIMIAAINVPSVTAKVTKAVCGQNGSIEPTVIGGIPPYSYLWNPTGSTSSNIYNLSSGVYWLTISDSVGCTILTPFYVLDTLVVKDSILSKKHTTCGLNNGSIKVHAYEGLPPYYYTWSNGIVGPSSDSISNLAPGLYSCLVTDANNCSHVTSTYINASSPLDIQFYPSNTHCNLTDNGGVYSSILYSTQPIKYTWSNSDTTSSIFGLSIGNYTLSVVDANGCLASDTVSIYDDGSPSLSIASYQPPLCHGDSNGVIVFNGFGGVQPYKYSLDGVSFSTTAQINNVKAGSYIAYIRDANSCLSDTTVLLGEPDELLITRISSDTNSCFEDQKATISVDVIGGITPYNYQIDSVNMQSGSTFSNLGSGMYTILVTDANGCSKTAINEVIGPKEKLEFTKWKTDIDCYVDNTGALKYEIKGGWPPYKHTWSHTNSNALEFTGLDIGQYSIYIEDDRGCTLDDMNELVRKDCCHVYLPNAFSPNNDGKNDIFRGISINDVNDIYMVIYDRWGNRVFESTDFKIGWDGTIGSRKADDGTYFYMVTFICNLTAKKVFLKGDVTLIR